MTKRRAMTVKQVDAPADVSDAPEKQVVSPAYGTRKDGMPKRKPGRPRKEPDPPAADAEKHEQTIKFDSAQLRPITAGIFSMLAVACNDDATPDEIDTVNQAAIMTIHKYAGSVEEKAEYILAGTVLVVSANMYKRGRAKRQTDKEIKENAAIQKKIRASGSGTSGIGQVQHDPSPIEQNR